jgi:hypothetical protein
MGFSRKVWATLLSDGGRRNAPEKGDFHAALLASKSGVKEGADGPHFPLSLPGLPPPLKLLCAVPRGHRSVATSPKTPAPPHLQLSSPGLPPSLKLRRALELVAPPKPLAEAGPGDPVRRGGHCAKN